MLTTEECPEMNVGTGKFSDDVEMTVEATGPRKKFDDIFPPCGYNLTTHLTNIASANLRREIATDVLIEKIKLQRD